MTPADWRYVAYYAKMTLKFVWYMCLVPIAIFGMFFLIPFLALRFLFYGVGIATVATTATGRQHIVNAINGDTYTGGASADSYLEVGFNVDLERDFMGTPQVRK